MNSSVLRFAWPGAGCSCRPGSIKTGGLLLLSDGDRQVAQLVFETAPGAEHVTDLCVDRDLRRQGVASYLWSYARSRCVGLRHDHLGAMTMTGGFCCCRRWPARECQGRRTGLN